MQKIIQFKPAYDKRDPDPSKNYGIHCMDMFMVLKGPLGAISFTIYTGWHLQSLNIDKPHSCGASICYHSPVSQYEDEGVSQDSCEWIDGKPCYCDCSYTAADDLFHKFVAEGEQIVWDTLQQWYDSRFLKASTE